MEPKFKKGDVVEVNINEVTYQGTVECVYEYGGHFFYDVSRLVRIAAYHLHQNWLSEVKENVPVRD